MRDRVNVQSYHTLITENTKIEKLIQEMMNSGIICHNTSMFSSHVLLVKKKDETWRFCVDYRALNNTTIKDQYQQLMN